jgi:lysophospholipase L1-like esterase
MPHTHIRRAGIAARALVTLAVSACSSGVSDSQTSPPPRSAATIWHVVVLGDSFTATQNSKGRTYVDVYAASLQTSEGRMVEVDDLSDDANTTARLLEHLRTDDSTRAKVGAADIIVISVGGNDSDPFAVYPDGTCSPTQTLADCLTTYAPTFAANYEGILEEVVTLRSGKATAIRVSSADNPFVGWSEAPTATFGVDFYAQVAAAETEAACSAATEHGALCVDYLHILGGPDGTADPAPFLGPDHAHPGDVGIQAIGDALIDLGVEELH